MAGPQLLHAFGWTGWPWCGGGAAAPPYRGVCEWKAERQLRPTGGCANGRRSGSSALPTAPSGIREHNAIQGFQHSVGLRLSGLLSAFEGSDFGFITMFLARVEGAVVSTKKDPAMNGRKLLLIRPQLVDDKDPTKFRPGANTIVAVDCVGSGVGEMVLFCQGSSARLAPGMKDAPVDAVLPKKKQ